MNSQKKRVVLIGGTGNLGQQIGEAILDRALPDVELALLVRPGSEGKAAPLLARGALQIEGSLDDEPARLEQALRGAFCVVSAVQGGPEIIIGAQSKLLAAARAAGVRRFIPSDFSFDLFSLIEGENMNADWRRRFAEHAAAQRGDVQVVHVLNGCFLDAGVLFGFLGMFDLAQGQMFLWGDGKAPMDFTTYADTAAYTARAATEDDVPERFEVAGETLTFWELKREVEAGIGRPISVIERGSLDDLDREIAQRQAAAPNNPWAWLPLTYLRPILAGRGRLLGRIEQRFPEIRPVGVRAYAAAHLAKTGAAQ